MTAELLAVAKVGDVREGDIIAVRAGEREMILYRWRDQLYAAQRRCPHQGSDLAEGLVMRGAVVCARHGWRFIAENGVLETSPYTCLVTYRVEVRGDDVLVDPTPIYNAKVPE